ncbi:MAG: acyl-CoA reductase [Saprospiraceae bacterium]|nr:acyl-CoA reductase [Saprospiraceae bacterium]
MKLHERIQLLNELGDYLRTGGDEDLDAAIQLSYIENQWFTVDNIRLALDAVASVFLQKNLLENWAANYPISDSDFPAKTVGLVMAGNIPLVGFHDWLCVFVSGNRAKVKLSDKDKRLLPLLVKKMGEWSFKSLAYTEFIGETEKLSGFDAVIATGSNNTARYFEQYFGKYPHIIRRNRNAVAVLNGLETKEELYALGNDIFSYFGLGCRNVSKLYVPHGYQFDTLLEVLHDYREIIHHNKYKNNFDYNMTLFVLNKMPYLNNGCLMLREDPSLSSRIASVHYEYYDDIQELDALLLERTDEIQCVVGNTKVTGYKPIPFGGSQQPGLSDYPDGVDIMQFLTA